MNAILVEAFHQLGAAKVIEDPAASMIPQLKEKIDRVLRMHPDVQAGLKSDWSNFMEYHQLRALLVKPDAHEHLATPAKLRDHCGAHVSALLVSRAKLDLAGCVARAKAVELAACFGEHDEKLFSFLAEVYGTDPLVASAPDESIIAFFAGEKPSRSMMVLASMQSCWFTHTSRSCQVRRRVPCWFSMPTTS